MRLQAVVVVVAVVVVALASAGGVFPECPEEYHKGTQINTDLSGITDFGLDLYRQLSPADSSSNFFFSPYSIWTALALTYLGSNGNTKLQLETALRIKDKASTYGLLNALKTLYQQRANNAHYAFSVANRVYYDSMLTPGRYIQNVLREELEGISPRNANEAAEAVNRFVSSNTNGRIREIVSPRDLKDFIMLLVNAVYFKGTWVNQFDPSITSEQQFYVTSQKAVPVDMMYIKSNFRYSESQELRAQVLEVPYSGDDMSMVLLLPTEEGPRGFQNTVEALNGADLRTLLDTGLQETSVILQLPRFKMEHTIKRKLIEALQNLGVRDLFNPRADLSDFGLSKPLYLSKAIHKAFVEVNEEGTEAAAATALAYHRSGRRSVQFNCNRPFLFLIHDKVTRNVLFFGAYKNPAS